MTSKIIFVCCLLLLLTTSATNAWSWSNKATPAPMYGQNGVYYQPTTKKQSYIKNALKGAALGVLGGGAYTMYKNGK
uniref:Uncharacterized protein n=1 Tax=Panagrolaimus sp. PS1159 TaxID=55785 RepID=A0AC35FG40_9BILA